MYGKHNAPQSGITSVLKTEQLQSSTMNQEKPWSYLQLDRDVFLLAQMNSE